MFQKKPFFKKFNRPFTKPFVKQNKERINEQIRVSEIRVIDETGTNLGVLSTEKALQMAKDRGLDLVEVAENIQPPICKIIDYGKYKYIQEQKEKKQQSSQKKSEIKGVRIGLATSAHDLAIRIRQIDKFFKEGHKVRVEMKLRGREKAHFDLAKTKLELFINTIPRAKKEDIIKRSPQGLSINICQGKAEDQLQKDSK